VPRKADPIPLQLTTPAALRIIRAAAEDSARVFFTTHAIQRMKLRKITRVQVLDCLRRGTISEPPHRDVHGNWKCNVSRFHAGDTITAAVGLKRDEKTGDYLIVITVFGE